MFDTIFKKQFITYMGCLIISFLLLGISLTQVFNDFFIKRKEKTLITQAEVICNLLKLKSDYSTHGGVFESYIIDQKLTTELTNLERYLGISFIVIDDEFNILKCSQNLIRSLDLNTEIAEIPELRVGRSTILKGNLGGILREDAVTVATPIVPNGIFEGAILFNSSIPEIEKSVWDITKVTMVLLVASGLLAFVLIYVSTKTITKPLHQMNQAAKVISSGDFEKRIDVSTKDEVGQLANSFNLMAESLQQQELKRSMFIENISHDLRSPLTSMGGFLQAILDGTIPKENQDRYLEIILDETNRLAKLANDIMDINKLQILEITPTKFDINEIIRKTIIQFEQRILDKNIDIYVIFADDKTIVNADFDKIQRVVYNLLDNAIKFTNENGKIKVETNLKDKKLFVSIKDNGIGIPTEEQNHIFDRFYKVDYSRGKDRKGSGLGLAIIKEFIKAHGETITLISKENEGSEFIFSLPVEEEII